MILSKKLSELCASSVKSLLASFGTEGEFLDADEGRVLDSNKAQKRPEVRLLRIERFGCALAVIAAATLYNYRALAFEQTDRTRFSVAERDARAQHVVEPGLER